MSTIQNAHVVDYSRRAMIEAEQTYVSAASFVNWEHRNGRFAYIDLAAYQTAADDLIEKYYQELHAAQDDDAFDPELAYQEYAEPEIDLSF